VPWHKQLRTHRASRAVIIPQNKWGEAFKPLSQLPVQAVQSNMVYQPREAFMVSFSIAARRINADRYTAMRSLGTKKASMMYAGTQSGARAKAILGKIS